MRIILWNAVILSLVCSTFCLAQSTEYPLTALDSLLDVRISTAAKYEQTAGEAPASVTIVTAEEIRLYGYRTLSEILANVHGFYIRNDRSVNYVGVRGFESAAGYNNRILLLINGHILNDNYIGSSSWDNGLGLNLDAVERVEIVRGPGSSLYGTSAMFAVVNVISREGAEIGGVRVRAEAGSFGERGVGLTVGNTTGYGLDWLISGQLGRSDGEDLYFPEFVEPGVTDGWARGLDWDRRQGLMLRAKYGDFTLQGCLNARKKGVPGAPWLSDFNTTSSYYYEEYKNAELKYERAVTPGQELMLRAYVDHYGLRGAYPYDGLTSSEKYAGDWMGSEARYRWDPKPFLRLICGVDLQKHIRAFNRSWDYPDEVYFDEDHPYHLFSAYVQQELQIDPRLVLTLGLRYDKRSCRKSSSSPRAALVFSPSHRTTLKLLYGRAFRAPNVYEVYYKAPFLAVDNPDLMPERIESLEFVLEQRLCPFAQAMVSLYSNRMERFIVHIERPDDGMLQFINGGSARSRGVELGLDAEMPQGLRGYAGYAWQLPRDLETGDRLPNSPRHLFQLGLSRAAGILEGGLQYRWASSQANIYGGTVEGASVVDLNLEAEIVPETLTFSLRALNLLNERYAHPAGLEYIQESMPQPGRSIVFRVDCKF